MSTLYDNLRAMHQQPEPFSIMTTSDLWTDEHISKQMLAFHLNENLDVASRNIAFIDRSVEWICQTFNVGPATRIADFGCGPGLYSQRLARHGARVTGIDFSSRSIEYARQQAQQEGLEIEYVNQDYLSFEPKQSFDLIILMMCDFCALGPVDRAKLLEIFSRSLVPGGAVLFDVYSLAAFAARSGGVAYARNQMDGFWSSQDYYGFQHTFKYEEEKVMLDRYTILEADRERTIYNWLQYFSRDSLDAEMNRAGYVVDQWLGDVAGSEFDPSSDEYALVAHAV